MKLTDPSAIQALKKVNIGELSDMIADYPESDVDGRTDWEMIGNDRFSAGRMTLISLRWRNRFKRSCEGRVVPLMN